METRLRPELWKAVVGGDSTVERRGENLRWFGDRLWILARIVDSEEMLFLVERENCVRVHRLLQFYNESNVRGGTRRLPTKNEVSRKKPLVNGRGRTYSHPMR